MIHRFFGVLILTGSMMAVFFFEGMSHATGILRILHWPAMVLTGLGPMGLILISYEWEVVLRTLTLLTKTSPEIIQKRLEREANVFHRLGQNFYAEGAVAFEQVNPKGLSETARKAIERLSVRVPMGDIKELVLSERDRIQVRIVQCLSLIGMGVKLAPSIGMLGTILGMVRLLETLSDPTHIGPHMSLALLTTFFGLFFSLIIWTPFQQKVERIFELELETHDQVARWLEFMEKRKPADYFAETAEIPESKRSKPGQAA